jgi:hypothetical protein
MLYTHLHFVTSEGNLAAHAQGSSSAVIKWYWKRFLFGKSLAIRNDSRIQLPADTNTRLRTNKETRSTLD